MIAARFAPSLLGAVALVLSSAGIVRGDIYVWSDAAGIEHYTNSLDGVPEDRRGGAKPFVRERPRAAPAPVEEVDGVEPEPPEAAEAAEDVGDRLQEAYAAGHEAGVALASPPTVIEVMPAPVVQQAAVFVEAPRPAAVVFGSFLPAGDRHRRHHRPPRRRHEPAAGPFVTGPAGPPPLGAPGPPPLAAGGLR